jgi:VWFA-related protein
MVRARGWRVWAALSAGTAAAVALTIHAQAPSQDASQLPSFRAGVNLVRVDVLATDRGGRALDTLTADDFEIRENGVRQAIGSFKRVYLNGNREPGGDALRPITSDAIEATEAAREDVRLFAVLLDDYHVKRGSSLWVREQLARWVETQLGPADMIGVMYPLEAMADMHLTRDRDLVQVAFRRFAGRKHNYWPENEIEQRYVFRLSAEEIERTRTRVTFGAIEALIARLGALKEGRKSLILVTEGFANSLPAALVNYHGGLGGPSLPGALGRGGGPATPDSSTFFKSVDLDEDLREITNLANRQNVSIDPVDPRGLGASEYGGDLPEVDDRTNRMYQQLTTTTLRVLAENRDGRAIVNRNDITMAMKQIVSDASAYYLLGYSSTLPASDGKFHPIDVRVKRSGVELRHRRGYWAPTAEEAARVNRTAAAAPAPNPVADAIGAMRARDARMIHTWIGTSPGDAGRTRLTLVWETSARRASNSSARPARVLFGASAAPRCQNSTPTRPDRIRSCSTCRSPISRRRSMPWSSRPARATTPE